MRTIWFLCLFVNKEKDTNTNKMPLGIRAELIWNRVIRTITKMRMLVQRNLSLSNTIKNLDMLQVWKTWLFYFVFSICIFSELLSWVYDKEKNNLIYFYAFSIHSSFLQRYVSFEKFDLMDFKAITLTMQKMPFHVISVAFTISMSLYILW